MSFDLSKAVLRPNERENLAVGPSDIGRIIIKVDPRNTGETRLAMGVQVLEPGGVIPVHLHEGLEELIFVYAGHGKTIVAEDEFEWSRERPSTFRGRCGTASRTPDKSPSV